MTDPAPDHDSLSQPPARQAPSPAAQRALAEAAARRAVAEQSVPAPERGGRGGPEPVRYGDWEVRGLASDF